MKHLCAFLQFFGKKFVLTNLSENSQSFLLVFFIKSGWISTCTNPKTAEEESIVPENSRMFAIDCEMVCHIFMLISCSY